MNEARNSAPGRADWPMGLDRATADARYLRKNSVQVNAADNLQLGAAPPISGGVRVDAGSFSNVGYHSQHANAVLHVGLRMTRAGAYQWDYVVNGAINADLRFQESGAEAWSFRVGASISTLLPGQATARIVAGSNGLQLRDPANVATWLNLDNVGNVAISAGVSLSWLGRSAITSPINGNLALANNAGTDFGLLQFGGTTSAFPAIARATSNLQVRLADNSANASLIAANGVFTAVAGSFGAGTVTIGGTTATTVGAAGGASALPATPLGYIIINVAGTQAKIPYYNN